MKTMRDLWFTSDNTPQPQPPVPVIYVRDARTIIYKIIARDVDAEAAPTEAELNALGAEGWQIAGITTLGNQLTLYLQKLAD